MSSFKSGSEMQLKAAENNVLRNSSRDYVILNYFIMQMVILLFHRNVFCTILKAEKIKLFIKVIQRKDNAPIIQLNILSCGHHVRIY